MNALRIDIMGDCLDEGEWSFIAPHYSIRIGYALAFLCPSDSEALAPRNNSCSMAVFSETDQDLLTVDFVQAGFGMSG